MKTVLLCTVGGSADPIIQSIREVAPDHVAFICSEDDPISGHKGSYTEVEQYCRNRDGSRSAPIVKQLALAEGSWQIEKVPADDLNEVYQAACRLFERFREDGYRLVADYTGGTKTMSAGLVFAATQIRDVKLRVVTGARSNLQKITTSGSGRRVRLGDMRWSLELEKVEELWRNYRYEAAVALIDKASQQYQDIPNMGHRVRHLSQAFSAWDRFQHASALDLLQDLQSLTGVGQYLGQLKLLVRAHEGDIKGELLRIADLWLNARRRAQADMWDDAVARCYRLVECAAQWILKHWAGIPSTAAVPRDRLPEELSSRPGDEKSVRLGLNDSWLLAACLLEGAIGEFWTQQRDRLRDLLQARNHSILAHGFEPAVESSVRPFMDWIDEALWPFLLQLAEEKKARIQIPPQLPNSFAAFS